MMRNHERVSHRVQQPSGIFNKVQAIILFAYQSQGFSHYPHKGLGVLWLLILDTDQAFIIKDINFKVHFIIG